VGHGGAGRIRWHTPAVIPVNGRVRRLFQRGGSVVAGKRAPQLASRTAHGHCLPVLFTRAALCWRGYYSYGAVSVCLSVCLSVYPLSCCHLATAGASDSSLALDCCARYQVFVCMSATSRCSIKKDARISTIRDAILTCARKPT